MAVRKLAVLACTLGVLAGGCGSISEALRGIGFESRASRLYRKQKADNSRLAAQNAEYETRLASMTAEQDRLRQEYEAKLAGLEAKPAAPQAEPEPAADNNAKWAKLLQALGADAEPLVTPDGKKAVRVRGDVFFRSGKTSVRTEARPILTKIATAIRDFDDDVIVFVDGHTDSVPLRYTKAKYGDNYGLGAARATSVARELVSLGVPRSRLVTRSFGKDKPIADNATATGRKKNRRVEFTFAFTNVRGATALDR